jgi:thioredoxin 1
MKNHLCIVVLAFFTLLVVADTVNSQFSGWSTEARAQESGDSASVPAKGMVTMIDLGAKACIPCKMMAPVMEKVEKDYRGRAVIIFIDVWEDKEPAQRFGIRAIPTQLFFDKEGREMYRHVGFMSEEAIVSQLQKMGVN